MNQQFTLRDMGDFREAQTGILEALKYLHKQCEQWGYYRSGMDEAADKLDEVYAMIAREQP